MRYFNQIMTFFLAVVSSLYSFAQTNEYEADTIAGEELNEIVVFAGPSRLTDLNIGADKINLEAIVKQPTFLGERDILKSIQLMPGVKSEGDGMTGFQVRGGTSTQNAIYLDDVPVYNAGHLMGIFSTFNDDVIRNAVLYKGFIPAQFGGGTSSILDLASRTGNMSKWRFGGSVGLLSAKIYGEGPVVKDKASLLVAVRRSYLDAFLKLAPDYRNSSLYFYDINARFSWRIGENDNLYVTFFRGYDNLGMKDIMAMKWGNTTANAKWMHYFGNELYLTSNFSFSNYLCDTEAEMMSDVYTMGAFLRHFTLKENLVWRPLEGHKFEFGYHTQLTTLKSADWTLNITREKEQRRAWENTVFFNDEWKISDKLQAAIGLRLNMFSVLGGSPYYGIADDGEVVSQSNPRKGEFVKTYFTPEPRASINYSISDMHSVKLAYSRSSQNIHALKNMGMSLPFDRYAMTSNIIKPEISNQVSIGYFFQTKDRSFDFSIESYYKSIDHIYDYRDGKTFNSDIIMERLILGGKGRSYGFELLARKNTGKFTGWLGYTLAWAQNKINGINNNRWYTASNDRRHDVKIVAMYDFTKRWSASATWTYTTGQALTAPSGKYNVNGETVYYYAERNGYRAPANHRLDLSVTHTTKTKKWERVWAFGLYNVYNRKNPFMITFSDDDNRPTGTVAKQISLFGIIPSISFTIKY